MKALLITAGIALLLYVSYRTYRLATLAKGLEAKIAAGATLLDVRTVEEYRRGHLEGAVNIALGTLRQRWVELDRHKTYITCCSHGLRSVKAESLLKARGFKNVYNGGAWTDLKRLMPAENAGKPTP